MVASQEGPQRWYCIQNPLLDAMVGGGEMPTENGISGRRLLGPRGFSMMQNLSSICLPSDARWPSYGSFL